MKKLYFSITVSIFKEDKVFVAYSPMLDLSSCGKTLEEARKMFNEATEAFFEELEQKGTTNEVLASLGWKKVNSNWFPPAEVAHSTQDFSLALKA